MTHVITDAKAHVDIGLDGRQHTQFYPGNEQYNDQVTTLQNKKNHKASYRTTGEELHHDIG